MLSGTRSVVAEAADVAGDADVADVAGSVALQADPVRVTAAATAINLTRARAIISGVSLSWSWMVRLWLVGAESEL